MREDEKLTYYEAWCLFALTSCYLLFNDVMSLLTEAVGSAAWMAQLLSVLLAFAFLGLFLLLYNRYPGKDLLEIFDCAFGTVVSKGVCFLLLTYLLFYCAVSLNQLIEILQYYAYTRMRALVIDLLIMTGVGIFALYTVKGMAKVVSVVLPVIFIAWVITLLLAYNQYDSDLLNPIFGYGLGSTALFSFDLLSQFSGVFILGIFGKAMGDRRGYRKAATTGILVASSLIVPATLCFNMAVPYTSAPYIPAGIMGLAESTYNNRFLQKLEVVFTAVSVASIILLIGVSFLAVKKVYCHIFTIGQDFSKGVIIPLSLLVICITRTIGTNIQFKLDVRHVIRRQGGMICLVFILLTLLVSALRRQGGKRALRSLGLLLVPCLLLGALSGCTDAHEPDEDMYPIIMGFDKGVNEKFTLTLKFMLPDARGGSVDSISEEGGGGRIPQDMMVLECPSFTEGINMVNALLPKEVSFLHVKMMVISEELARNDGVEVFVGQALRFSEIKPTMAIVVSKCSAYELIEAQKSEIGDSLQMDMERILEPHKTSTYYLTRNMSQLLYEIKSTYGDGLVAYGNINQSDYSWMQEEGEAPNEKISHTTATFAEGYLAGNVPIMGNSDMELAGTAVFHKDKMVGTLNTRESQMIGLLNGSFVNAYIVLPDLYQPETQYISLVFRKVRAIHYSTGIDEEGTARVKISVPVNVIIGVAQNPDADYINDPQRRQELSRYVEETMNQRAEELIEKLQTELRADALQLGRRVARNFRTIPEWEAYDWDSRFPEAKIEVSFDINL